MANVVAAPSAASSTGKSCCTPKLTAELISPTNEIASPRIRFGNSSENSTHITGPSETANEATKPRMPIRISIGFIVMADVMRGASYSVAAATPMASWRAVLKATSLSNVCPMSGVSPSPPDATMAGASGPSV